MFSIKPFIIFVALVLFAANVSPFELMNQSALVHKLTEPPIITSLPDPTQRQRTYVEPGCGEVFTGNNSGGIFHKVFGRVVDNERCVWIIAVPGAVGYRINIHLLVPPTNTPNSGQNLIISGIRHGGPTGLVDPVFTSYMPVSYGSLIIEDANILVVTFYTEKLNSAPGTGFILQYQPIYTGNITVPSLYSRHNILKSPLILSRHPPSGSYYDLELSSFLFVPRSNIYTGTTNHIMYQLESLQYGATCLDSLFVYTFNRNPSKDTGIWQQNQRLCWNVTSQYIPSDDLVLVLFQSDRSSRASGFRFSSFSC